MAGCHREESQKGKAGEMRVDRLMKTEKRKRDRSWRRFSFALAAGGLLMGTLITGVIRHKAMDEDRQDARRVVDEFMPYLVSRESLETYPVEFSIEGVRYRIPRNYLKYMQNWKGGPQSGITIEVLYPGLQGRTPETLPYFEKKKEGLTIEVNIGHKTSWAEGPVDLSIIGKLQPEKLLGFDHYIQGPPNAESHSLLKQGKHNILYTSFSVDTTDEWNYKIAVMNTTTAINSTNQFHYILNYKYLPELEDINNALYDLIASFTVKE